MFNNLPETAVELMARISILVEKYGAEVGISNDLWENSEEQPQAEFNIINNSGDAVGGFTLEVVAFGLDQSN